MKLSRKQRFCYEKGRQKNSFLITTLTNKETKKKQFAGSSGSTKQFNFIPPKEKRSYKEF